MGRSESVALIAGGIAAAVLFVPFTLTHGPTSYNLEREFLGWDRLWRLRDLVAGTRRVTVGALAVVCTTMFLFVAMNVAFGGIGPLFDLFLLAPATVVSAATTTCRGTIRVLLVLKPRAS